MIDNKNHWLHLAQVAESKQPHLLQSTTTSREGNKRRVSFANSATGSSATLKITSSQSEDSDGPNKEAHININNNNNCYSVTNHNDTTLSLIAKHSLDVDQRRSNQEILGDIDRLAANKADDQHEDENARKTTNQVGQIGRNNGAIDVRQRNGTTDKEMDQK